MRWARQIYDFQSLQGHSLGSYIFMAELKTSKNFAFFKSIGTNSQFLGRKEPNGFIPWYIPLTDLVKKSD